MQEFLTNNTVSCNLMSLTGYRTLVVLDALLESPKSNDEINTCLLNNQYIGENFSGDTLRIYINSLRAIGCEITKASKTNNKYKLISHPFDFDITNNQINSLKKLYDTMHDKVEISDLLMVEELFDKILKKIQNKETAETLKNISYLKNIKKSVIKDLIRYCKNKNQIVFTYNSLSSEKKDIELIADKLAFTSKKLYIFGTNLNRKEYSYFLVDKIEKIKEVKLKAANQIIPSINVKYEILMPQNEYILDDNEKIIDSSVDKIIIETEEKNEFRLIQKILSMADKCVILEPEELKQKVINKLNMMEKAYEKI